MKRAKAMLRANDLKMISATEQPEGALSSKALKKQHTTQVKRPSSSYKDKQQRMHDRMIQMNSNKPSSAGQLLAKASS